MNFRGKHQPNPIAFQIAPMVDFLLVVVVFAGSVAWEIHVTPPSVERSTLNPCS